MRVLTALVRVSVFTLLWAGICLGQSGREPLVVVQHGKYGYIDHEGKIIIRTQFIWADDFWQGLGTVYVCGRYVSIDRSGVLHPLRIAVERRLDPKRKDKKAGFVDASGHFAIAPTFDDVLPFSDGLAAVRSGENWGFIDKFGQVVIPIQFKAAYYFREGVTMVEADQGTSLSIGKAGFSLRDLSQETPSPKDGSQSPAGEPKAIWICRGMLPSH